MGKRKGKIEEGRRLFIIGRKNSKKKNDVFLSILEEMKCVKQFFGCQNNLEADFVRKINFLNVSMLNSNAIRKRLPENWG
jgi:hypothetical protein